jgi:hypothetical protein
VSIRSNKVVPETMVQSSPTSAQSNKPRRKSTGSKEEQSVLLDNDIPPDLSSSVKALSSKVMRSISAKMNTVVPFDEKRHKNYQHMAIISSGGILDDLEVSSFSSTGSSSPSPPMVNEFELPNTSCFVREYRVNDRLHYFMEV